MIKGKFNVCRRLMAIIMVLVLVGGLIPAGEFAPLCVKAQEEQYMVTVNVNDEAGGKIQIETRPAQTSDNAYFDEGTEITVKAIPDEGYRLAFWGGTRPLGEPGSCEFKTTVNSAGNYMANFVSTTAEVSASMEDIEIEKKNAGYSVSYINPSNFSATHQTYAEIKLKNDGACNLGIQDFTLSGKNADCFHVFRGFSWGDGITEADQDDYYNLGVGQTLTHWYVEPVSGLEVGTYEATLTLVEQCQGGLTTPVSANVKFVVTDDAVIKTEDDGNGTVTGAGNYEKGTNVTLTATPDEHYIFDSWWCDGSEVSKDNPYTFKAETSATYEAHFKQVDFLLTATATEGGKVQIEDRASTASTDYIYSSGATTINIKAIPDEGYRLAYWSRIDFYGESTKPVGDPGACDFATTLDKDVEYVAHFVSTSTPASATLENIEIDKQSVGYTVTKPYMIGTIAAGTNHYTYKNIELKNTGDCSLAMQDITLSGKDANCFNVFRGSTNFYSPELIVESDIKNYVIDSNSTLSGWYIEPKVGLGVGTYEATLTLVEQCQNGLKEQVSAKVSFSVTCEHTETELRNRKDPTDTEQGYTGDLCCIECGEIIEQGKTVRALGSDKETPTEEDKIPDEPGKNNEDKSVKDKVSPVTQTPATQSPADTTSHNPVADTPVTPVVKNENTTFVADNNKAEVVVTSKEGETPTVEYKAPADTSTKNVVIPETVTSEGIEYTVTAIAANAFKNNKKLTKVSIPASVKYIGKNAFCGCKNLKNVNIKTTKLTKKTVGANAFKNIHKKAVVKVPKSKLKAYKKLLKKVGVKGKKQKIK